MRIELDNTKMSTNGKFERQTFGVADMSIIINLLTKLYSNPKQTLTQEYISNARDANREAKSSRPIEITAPTRFNPLMSIRDFGLGLSPDRINNVFLLYGASTKRGTNNQTGGFGIGAKSAWSYTDSFNIITYIDGIQRTYIAHKSSGNGNLDLISEVKTSQPNGTEIQIAIKSNDVKDFKDAILRTIYFWNTNEIPVLKGFDVSEIFNNIAGLVINNNFSIHSNLPDYVQPDHTGRSLLVIDGIPYTISDYFKDTATNRDLNYKLADVIRRTTVISVNNGVVHVAPNREEIVLDDHNKDLLSKIVDKGLKDCAKYITDELAKNADLKTAIQNYIALKHTFKVKGNYKGFEIDNQGNLRLEKPTHKPTDSTPLDLFFIAQYGRGDSYGKKPISYIQTENLNNLYYLDVQGLSHAKINFALRKITDKDDKPVYLLNPDKPDHDMLKVALDAKPISSIDISDYAVIRQAKQAVAKQELTAHWYSGGTMKAKQCDVSDFRDLTCYATFDSLWYINRRDNSELIFYMKDKLNIDFFFIAKGNEKVLKGNSCLVKIEDFLANFQPSDDSIKAHLAYLLYGINNNNELGRLNILTKVKSKITDKTLKLVLELMEVSGKEMPKRFNDQIEKHKLYKELKDVLANAKDYRNNLVKEFPLLGLIIDPYGNQSQATKDALLDYLNKGV